METFVFARPFVKVLRWILKAASKDERRPALTYLYHNGSGVFSAADGFRMHLFKSVDPERAKATFHSAAALDLVLLGVCRNAGILNAESIAVTDQESKLVVSVINGLLSSDCISTFAVNPKLLADALIALPTAADSTMDECFIRLWCKQEEKSQTFYITVENTDCSAFAVVMPMTIKADYDPKQEYKKFISAD